MALAVSIRFDFIDAKGKNSFTKIHVPTGFSIAQYTEFAQAAAQLLANASAGQITRASICFNVSLAGLGLKTVATSISSVARKLALRFRTDVTGFFAKTTIPGVIESQILDGSDEADQADAAIAAVISMFEDGIAPGTFTNDREMDIATIAEAKEQFRRRISA